MLSRSLRVNSSKVVGSFSSQESYPFYSVLKSNYLPMNLLIRLLNGSILRSVHLLGFSTTNYVLSFNENRFGAKLSSSNVLCQLFYYFLHLTVRSGACFYNARICTIFVFSVFFKVNRRLPSSSFITNISWSQFCLTMMRTDS